MASASKQIEYVETAREYVEMRVGVTLSLTLEEARTLAVVLANVGGNLGSPRKYADDVADALSDSGIAWDDTVEAGLIVAGDGYTCFRDYPDVEG